MFRFPFTVRGTAVAMLAVLLLTTGCVPGGSSGGSGGPGGPAGSGGDALDQGPLPAGVTATGLTLRPEVAVIERPGSPVVRQADADGAGYLLDGAVRGVDQLRTGDVVLVRDELVGRITSATPTGGDVHVRIAPVALTDVFGDGELSFHDMAIDTGSLQVHAWDDPEGVEPLPPTDDGGNGGWAPEPAGTGAVISTSAGTLAGSGDREQGPVIRRAASQQSVTVKSGDYDFTVSYTPVGASGIDMSIGLSRSVFSDHGIFRTSESSGRISGAVEVSLRNIAVTSDYQFRGGELVRGRQHVTFDGTASIQVDATVGETAMLAYRELVSIPWEISHTVFVYGVPFLVVVKFRFLISPAVSGVGTTLTFRTHADFAGSGTHDAAEPDTSGDGSGTATNDGVTNRVEGTGFGVGGMVFAIRPRVGFGLGVPKANAIGFGDAVVSVGVVNGSSIGITQCRKMTLDVTVRVGAEAALFGLEVEQTHQLYKAVIFEAVAPDSPACRRLLGGEG